MIATLLLMVAAATDIFTISGQVRDGRTGDPLPAALVVASGNGSPARWSETAGDGSFSIRAAKGGPNNISVTYMGYRQYDTTLNVSSDIRLDIRLAQEENTLREVIVTATEGRGITATSVIRQDAIDHIQPSSFADLLELIPGGMAQDPAFSSPQLINLRSANALTNSNYATSALGTRFMIDGRPIGQNANMQQTPGFSMLGSSHVDFGTDMREITTEDIESVDIIRGIAPVEYGDMTSGLVRIRRKKGGDLLHARFKADMKSKLLYAGKGFEQGDADNRNTLNASIGFLDSKADPREPRQSWKRLTGSLRAGQVRTGERFRRELDASFDYTGSFDNEKSDADLDYGKGGMPIETYKSDYNKFALAAVFSIDNIGEGLFRRWTASGSLTYEKDLISRWKHISNGSSSVISTSREEGEYDAITIPASYDASLQVDGQPLYLYFNTSALFRAGNHHVKAGAGWSMDKNYGKGPIFDTMRPFSPGLSVRPRAYSEIPATHLLSAFVEDDWKRTFGSWETEVTAGARVDGMGGAGNRFEINLKPYIDPRINFRIDSPALGLSGGVFQCGIYGGIGRHSKFPTMNQLYPDPIYGDITELNYWPVEEELRRILLRVYKIDPTNYGLLAARNTKVEIGLDASWKGFSLAVDCFREDMASGFRHASEYTAVTYKDYDTGAIDKSSLTAPPSIEGLPYSNDTLLTAYSFTTNGSRTVKEGMEFTFHTARINPIATKITANGAYFVTRHMNSIPEYWRPSITIGGKTFPYVGLYDDNDGSTYRSLTTNILFDTQIPRLGLIFSTAFQCQWLYRYNSEPDSAYPIAYIDKSATLHPFTEADRNDPILKHLGRETAASQITRRDTPSYMNVNLKVMKKLYHDKVSCSLFVNRILDVTPDYWRNGVLIRRSQTPYFGMELDFKI